MKLYQARETSKEKLWNIIKHIQVEYLKLRDENELLKREIKRLNPHVYKAIGNQFNKTKGETK
jgi:hypothetical protein